MEASEAGMNEALAQAEAAPDGSPEENAACQAAMDQFKYARSQHKKAWDEKCRLCSDLNTLSGLPGVPPNDPALKRGNATKQWMCEMMEEYREQLNETLSQLQAECPGLGSVAPIPNLGAWN